MTEAGPKPKERDRIGRFVEGNRARLIHGRFSRAVAQALTREQREVLDTLADREAAILSDLGGSSELSQFERDLLRRYEQLHAIAEYNAPLMLRSRGRVREQAVSTYMMCVDRSLKIIGQLGIHRRQKQINDLTLEEYVSLQEQREQRQQQADPSAHEERDDNA